MASVRPLVNMPHGALRVCVYDPDDHIRAKLTKDQLRCRQLIVHTDSYRYVADHLPPDLARLPATELVVRDLSSPTLGALLPDTDHVRALCIKSMRHLTSVTELPRHLVRLELQWCGRLESIPDLGALVTMQQLHLEGVHMCPAVLPPNLRVLAVAFRHTPTRESHEAFARAVAATPTLETISFVSDRYVTITMPPDVSMLPRLTSLTLVIPSGHDVPEHVFRCWHLRHLSIEWDTSRVSDAIAQLRYLCRLSLIPYSTGVPTQLSPCLLAMPMLQHTDLRVAYQCMASRVKYATQLRRRWFARHAVLILCSARLRRRRLPPELQRMVLQQLQAWAPVCEREPWLPARV
jgi:hypothetical protein